MSEQARDAVRSVAQLFPTAIISGRGREKVQQFVRLAELYYAGSHGMDIVGPQVGAGAGVARGRPEMRGLQSAGGQRQLDGVDGIALTQRRSC